MAVEPQSSAPKIRKARPEDARAIHDVHMRSINEVCAKDYPAAHVAAWGGRPYVEEHRLRAIREDDVWVVELGGRVAGFAHLKGAAEPDTGELLGLYLAPEALGLGLGKRALEAVEARAREKGWSRLKLGATLTAREFYLGQGFALDGEPCSVTMGGVAVPCLPMVKRLA